MLQLAYSISRLGHNDAEGTSSERSEAQLYTIHLPESGNLGLIGSIYTDSTSMIVVRITSQQPCSF